MASGSYLLHSRDGHPLHPVLPEALDGSPIEIHSVIRRGEQFFPVFPEDPLGVGAVASSSTTDLVCGDGVENLGGDTLRGHLVV